MIEVLGHNKLYNLDKLQSQSLNNQFKCLIESHNHVSITISDDEIIGRYELVTEHTTFR